MKNIILFLSILTFSLCTHGQTIHFAHVTDTHVGSQTGAADLASTVEDINRQKDIDFVLVTGDVTEFGSGEELR